jgi:hypothetical protein
LLQERGVQNRGRILSLHGKLFSNPAAFSRLPSGIFYFGYDSMKPLSVSGRLVGVWHAVLLASSAYGQQTFNDGFQYVNPLIGTADGG